MIANVVKGVLQKNGRRVLVNSSRSKGLYPYYYPFNVIPGKRIGFPEKAFWGVFITVGMFSVPVWVLLHLKEYRGETGESQ